MSNIPSPFIDKIKKRLEIAIENRNILDKQIEQATAVRNAYQGAVEQLEKVLAEDTIEEEVKIEDVEEKMSADFAILNA